MYKPPRTIVSSWFRPSRKHPSFPGIRRFTSPVIHVGIDTSGSISKKELTQFLSEVYTLARSSEVEVTAWDARSYKTVKARKPSDVITKVAKQIRGWGGTRIAPYLTTLSNRMRLRDIVVVLTDGDIWDIDEPKTRELLSNVASRASMSVIVSTHRELEIPRWQTIRIRVD